MLEPKILELRLIVNKVRTVLESADNRRCYSAFNDFPYGACSDASCILGMILIEQGFGNWDLVQGSRSNGQTHSWLCQDEVKIDITADQFNPTIRNWVNTTFLPTDPVNSFQITNKVSVLGYSQSVLDGDFHLLFHKFSKLIMLDTQRKGK